MENTIRTSRLTHRQQRIDIGIERAENATHSSSTHNIMRRLAFFLLFWIAFTVASFLPNATQATDSWRILPIRSEYEFNQGMTGGEAMQLPHGIARSESNPNYIYWNHDNSGPWMSSNGGDSWKRCLGKGIYQGNAGSIAVDPAKHLRVFALESQLWYGDDAEFDGLYRSVDGGNNWTLVLQKTVGLDWSKHRYIARNIAFDRSTMGSTKTTTMYVAMHYRDELPRWDPDDGGLYKSTDGGDSWTQLVASTIDKYYQITCGGSNVYLATDEGLKVYTTGSSYSALGDLPAGAVTSVFVHPTTQTTIYATVYHLGLYKSTNSGTNFTKIPLDDGDGGFNGEATWIYGGFYNNIYPDTIYVTGDSKGNSTWVTHDAGATWVWNDDTSNIPEGKYSVRIYGSSGGVVSSADDANNAIGFGNANIYKTTNGGVTFTESATLFTGYSTVYQTSFAFDKYNPNRFALGLADVGYYITNTAGAWFWRNWDTSDGSSVDDWKTACYIPCTGATIYCSCIDFSPTEDSETMISSVGYGTSNKANSRMMYLEDEATGWALETDYEPNSPPDPYPYWIKFAQYHRTDPCVVYLSDAISTDGGKSYTDVNFAPYTEYDYIGAPAEIVGQSFSHPNTIYAAYKFGQDVIRSNSRGDAGTWTLVGSPTGKMYRLIGIITFAVHPTNPNMYYTIDSDGDLASYDTETDTPTSLGVLDLVEHEETQLVWVKNIALDPRYPNIIYASIAGRGIENMWRSSDSGATWENISGNLPRIGSFSIAVSPLTGELLAGGLCGTYVLPPPYESTNLIYDKCVPISPSVSNAPVLDSIGDKSVNENTLLIFTVTATDANGDDVANITYSIQNEPSGARFVDGSFSWTPSYDQAGNYDSVRFIASDGKEQDSEPITITVKNVNRPPVAADDNATVAEDSGANDIDVRENDLDADGDTLTITAVTQPSHGDAVITGGGTGLTYTPVANYNGSDSFTYTVSDGNGGTDTATVTIIVNPGNQAPSAHAGVDQTLTDNDGNGSELVNLHGSGSTDPDGTIESWVWSDDRGDTILAGETTTPTLSVGTHTITLTATDDDGATGTDTVTVTINALDSTAPSVINYSPTDAAAQVPLNNLIILHILDDNSGVDVNSVTIKVNDDVVYTGNTTDYSSAWGHCRRTGTIADFTFVYQADQMFDFDQAINVTVNAADICGNAMVEHSHSFETEMFSFGENKNINADGLSKNYPATVQDSGGNIWAAWHAGATGSRDIYIAKLAAGAGSFAGSIRLTNAAADQCNPAVAIDADDKLYVLWQDNTQGNWDILIRTSADGAAWSAQRTVTDSNDNQTNPAVVVDGSLSRNVSVAWQDDRPGNTDIYIAVSGNDFVTKTTSQITSHTANQSEPAITADASNTIYVVWTDQRNGSNDIYGASSSIGPWTEVAVVTKSNSQSSPAIAAEQTGSILHLLWVDDISGDSDIYYASSDGLPGSPLTGAGIVDDTTGADQSQPAIVVTGTTGNSLKVFASWKDERNVSSNGDTDLYLVQIGSDENVFVGDDGTNSNQSKPALGVDAYGYPYLLWADSRVASPSIYYAGTTFVQSTALASTDVAASSGATVGADPAAISSADDVSVIVPAGACSSDSTITISKVENPPKFNLQRLSIPYDFGPSGIEFSQPVTITIPYTVPADGQYASAYWYNPLTGTLSQQGITNVSSTQISPTLYALSFKTTHFSQFIVGGGIVGSDGVSGGGGCSMSPSGQADLKEYLLPYIALAAVMLVLKLRDARRRRLQSTIRGGR